MTTPAKPTIYSVGYTGLPIEDFERFIQQSGATIADVRLKPFSRNSAWSKASLLKRFAPTRYYWLEALGNLNYKGGRILLANQDLGLAQLRALLEEGPVAVLCVCSDAATCHRTTVTTILSREGYPIHGIPMEST
jgi:uncharacterized protein (DUF488 family)